MNIRSKRFAIVLLTLIFTVSVFAVTAFAESNVTPVNEDPAAPITTVEPTKPGVEPTKPGVEPTKPGVEPTKPGDEPTKPGDEPILPDDGTTQPSDEPTQSGNEASEHSASSSKRQKSSSKPRNSSSKAVAPSRKIDTQANRVEATASQAAQAMSDPDVLSSENWSELLSSGDQTQNQNQAAGTSAVSSTASPAGVGGVSWILILGVVLIVLALCGFGLFVYLQFFSNNGDGPNRYGELNAPAEKDRKAPQTFTDISSASDGKQHRGDYVPNDAQAFADIRSGYAAAPVKQVAKPRTVKKAPIKDEDITRPIPRSSLPDRKPAVPKQGSQPLTKSQATPVTNDSDFDWEKFFNDQK